MDLNLSSCISNEPANRQSKLSLCFSWSTAQKFDQVRSLQAFWHPHPLTDFFIMGAHFFKKVTVPRRSCVKPGLYCCVPAGKHLTYMTPQPESLIGQNGNDDRVHSFSLYCKNQNSNRFTVNWHNIAVC